MAIVTAVSELRTERDSMLDSGRNDQLSGSALVGDEVKTPQGIITIYKTASSPDDEMVQDVRLVAMKTGNIVRVADDTKAWVYGEQALGNLGYVAQVKVGESSGTPIGNMIFIKFPELKRFVIAQKIYALDSLQELDDQTFSAIVWDGPKNARFIVVDTSTGATKVSRELDFRQSGQTSLDALKRPLGTANVAAPQNRYH